MNGNILNLNENNRGAKTYGFIFGEDGKEYFFYKDSLINCTIYQLEEGDCVEFNVEDLSEKKVSAVNIRKRYSSIGDTTVNNVFPGKNPNVNLNSYNEDERNIIEILQKALYVTKGASCIIQI